MPVAIAFVDRLARLRTLVVLLLLVAGLATSRAAAQGTSGALPDPITTQELMRWLDRYVKPTPAQWEAIDKLHEQYKEEFARLREGDIEKFMQSTQRMQGQLPTREAMKSFVDDWDKLRGRIKALDGRLLDNVQTVLDEGQMAAMPRVKLARERAVNSNPQMTGMAGVVPVDLTELVATLELDPAERAAIDPELVPYEQQATKRLTELSDSASTMMLELVDALSGAGFGDVNNEELMKDPERMKAFMEAMQNAFKESGRKAREKGVELAKLNNKARKQLAAKLPPEKAVRLRRDFIARAYPSAAMDDSIERTLLAARRLKAIDDAQRSAIDGMLAAWRVDDEKLEDGQIALQDGFALERSPFDFGGDAARKHEEAIGAIREKRTKAGADAIENVKAIVGPALAVKLDAVRGGGSVPSEDFAEAAGGGGGGESAPDEPDAMEAAALMATRNGGDQFLPAQITAAEVAGWSRRLGLDDGRRAILESIHSDYLQKWQNEVAPKVAAIGAAQQKAYRSDDDGTGNARFRSDPAAIESLYTIRQGAIEEVRRLEHGLFDDIKGAVANPDQAALIDAFSLGRATQVTGEQFMSALSESNESGIDLAKVIDDAVGDEQYSAIVVPVLLARSAELRSASAELGRTMLENQRLMEVVGARIQESGQDDAMSAVVEMQAKMAELSERTTAANEKRRDAVRAALDEIAAKLPAAEAAQLRRAYAKAAFPRIYEDRRSAAPLLERAQQLAALTETQKTELAKLAAEFEPAYDAASDRMAQVARESAGSFNLGGDPEAWKKWQDRRNRIDRIRFERNELSVKTVRRLGSILGPDLAAQVPGYSQYVERKDDSNDIFLP